MQRHSSIFHLPGTLIALAVLAAGASVEGGLPAKTTAARVDRLLDEELFAIATDDVAKDDELADESDEALEDDAQDAAGVRPGQADDETFLRRVSMDLIGTLPSPEEITAFVLDPSPEKRSKVVDRLLSDERYGLNWARYWRDVMLSRRSDERALIASRSVVEYLTEAFNNNEPWDELARSFIAAEGNLQENGNTALIASQWGQIPETAAEVSRVFLGVQIQCAQCHDHKTDRWTREQFHEFAAFFPRIAIRPIREDGKRRGFELLSREFGRQRGAKKKEKEKARAGIEHRMPDMEDPSKPGTVMQPVFFVSGQKLELGTSDRDRRETIAQWITDRKNPWFAKAFVNRMWAELVGEGFYEPIDDMGPDHECNAPRTVELLSAQFVSNDYDVKWLVRTITATDAYQRESRPPRNSNETPFAAVCSSRLRSDQVFTALASALEIEEAQSAPNGRAAIRNPRTPRAMFNAIFGYDPSDPRGEVQQSIPQALLLMNSPTINKAIEVGRRDGLLGQILPQIEDDEEVVLEIYLRCLAREPNEEELKTCLEYVQEVDDRSAAFEDILWALVNSAEFLHRN